MPTTLRIEKSGPRADVVLARPDVRNAFDDVLVRELKEGFEGLAADAGVRVIVLRGEGKVFSAGADLEWMRRMAGASREDNIKDAEAMAAMFRAIGECPKYVICRIQGAALGGGAGLAAAADAAVCEKSAVLGFTETRLGLVPAVISEWVLRRIGPGHARALFPTGERFSAATACRIGLVAEVVEEGEEEELDQAVDARVDSLLQAGPVAVTAAKRLVRDREEWAVLPAIERDRRAAALIAELRASPEAQEGMKSLLEKRKPGWYVR
jgi:methylglutaconyl-CoA hydratase